MANYNKFLLERSRYHLHEISNLFRNPLKGFYKSKNSHEKHLAPSEI